MTNQCTQRFDTSLVFDRARLPQSAPRPVRRKVLKHDPAWRNIYKHVGGYLVHVMRGGVKRHVLVSKLQHGANAFLVAQAARDALLATMGPSMERVHPVRIQRRSHSNTGYVGISETTKWIRNRRMEGFAVSLPGGKPSFKRIYYGGHRTRSQALAIAVKLRADWDAKRAVKNGGGR